MKHRIEAAALFGAAILLAGVALVEFGMPPDELDENTLPLVPYTAEVPETEGPITFFLSNCTRCHGGLDTAYSEFKNPRHGDALRQMLATMIQAQAMTPLDEAGQQQQYDLHLAIVAKTPYAWVDPNNQDAIVGETFPGAQVVLRTDTQRFAAASDEQRFVLPRLPGVIRITRDNRSITIPVPK